MADISSSNLYIDLDSLEPLDTEMQASIETLSTLLFDLEEQINTIEADELWKGESFDNFKDKYTDWRLKYIERLVELNEFAFYIKDIITAGELLIRDRKSIETPLL